MQMTVKDAAKALNVAEKTVYRWIQSGGLPAYRVAGTYRLNRAMLFEWATSKRVNITMETLEPETEVQALPTLAQSLEIGGIHYRVPGKDKEAVLRAVIGLLPLPEEMDRVALGQALLAREQLQSTGVGDGIALPHVRNPAMLNMPTPLVSLCFLKTPVAYGALDDKPVRILFVPLASTARTHLHLLARISFALRNAAFKRLLEREGPREDLLNALRKLDPSA